MRDLGFRFQNFTKYNLQKWHYYTFISFIDWVIADIWQKLEKILGIWSIIMREFVRVIVHCSITWYLIFDYERVEFSCVCINCAYKISHKKYQNICICGFNKTAYHCFMNLKRILTDPNAQYNDDKEISFEK